MKKQLIGLAVAAVMASASTHALADRFAVGVHAGTSGYGASATLGLTDNLNARLMYNHLEFGYDTDIDDFEYDLDLELSSFDLLLDWHVFGGSFRVTGGLIGNNNELTGNAVPRTSGTVKFGDQTFNVNDIERVDAKVEFDDFVPYVGIGWGNSLKGGKWTVTTDLGVMFQGSPDATISARASGTAPAGLQGMLDAAAAQEARDVQDDIKDFRYYPVARVGITYRF